MADADRGQAALAFAKRYELLSPDALANIKLVEVDYSDPDSFPLTRKGRVLLVDGDTYVGGRSPDVSGRCLLLWEGRVVKERRAECLRCVEKAVKC